MAHYLINGNRPLRGSVSISGSKNGSLLLLAASLLTNEDVTIRNIPEVTDVKIMIDTLKSLGMEVAKLDHLVHITKGSNRWPYSVPRGLANATRGSVCLLGPLLAKRGRVCLPIPGGCTIGPRPIDIHVKGLRKLGVDVHSNKFGVTGEVGGMHGGDISALGPHGSSVTATANFLMASVLTCGETTTIHNAAQEPEVLDLVKFLSEMGGNIIRKSDRFIVKGVDKLRGIDYVTMPDRIEACTYLMVGFALRGPITVYGIGPSYIGPVIKILRKMGAVVTGESNCVSISSSEGWRSVGVTTEPYPGFPTDVQPLLIPLLCVGEGDSVVKEKVFPQRFAHVKSLISMGGKIDRLNGSAIIHGVKCLKGTNVEATDLRGGAGLVIAGLMATGVTKITGTSHIERGYENMVGKLKSLGAEIECL